MVAQDEIAIVYVARAIGRSIKLFWVIWLSVFLLVLALALYLPSKYRAELVLVHVEGESDGGLLSGGGQLGQLAGLAGISVNQSSSLQKYLALLQSRQFIQAFVTDNGLIPILYAGDWNSEAQTWVSGEEREMSEVIDDFLDDVMSIDVDDGAGLIRIRIDWTDGELAASWANEIGDALNALIRGREIEEATATLEFLNEEIQRSSVKGVEQAIFQLIESNIGRIAMANVRHDFAFQVIDPATPPAKNAPMSPKRGLIAAVGLVFGFLVACCIAVFRDIWVSRRAPA